MHIYESNGRILRAAPNADRNTYLVAIDRAEAIDARAKGRGQHGGFYLKSAAPRVARYLMKVRRNHKTGQCNPSIDTIAGDVGLCRNTVIKALKCLQALGFIKWVSGGQRGRGGRIHRASNRYTLLIPDWIAQMTSVDAYRMLVETKQLLQSLFSGQKSTKRIGTSSRGLRVGFSGAGEADLGTYSSSSPSSSSSGSGSGSQ